MLMTSEGLGVSALTIFEGVLIDFCPAISSIRILMGDFSFNILLYLGIYILCMDVYGHILYMAIYVKMNAICLYRSHFSWHKIPHRFLTGVLGMCCEYLTTILRGRTASPL